MQQEGKSQAALSWCFRDCSLALWYQIVGVKPQSGGKPEQAHALDLQTLLRMSVHPEDSSEPHTPVSTTHSCFYNDLCFRFM